MSYAPIALFTYNRPNHTRRVIRSLKTNPELQDSPITIYCDGAKNHEHEASVTETRHVVDFEAPLHATIVKREANFGLAKSIIAGVSELTEKYGSAIIIEDDLVLTSGALAFLNEGLKRYVDNDKVMHVSAYMFPVDEAFEQPFFYREATCWGWATWDRAWKHFNPDAASLLNEVDKRGIRNDYDVRGSMFFYQMLKMQNEGKLDSWAIRWYTSMFLRDGLALHPAKSYVENLGFDGSGVHCNIDDRFYVATTSQQPKAWPDQVEESEEAIAAMIRYRRGAQSFKGRVKRRIMHFANKINPFS